jgi:hypothetical protein
MGQSAAQPILDLRDKLYRLEDWLNGKRNTSGSKSSDSGTMNWKPEPNEEQQKWLEDHGYGPKKLADRKPLGSSKKTARKSARKPAARKKVR